MKIFSFALLCTLIVAVSCKKDDSQVATSNVSKSNFGSYHPCGIAISHSGIVAVSTYEGDTENGIIAIWNSLADFTSEKTANYQFEVKDPEAVVFDSQNNLFIACTYDSKVYFTSDFTKAPTSFFYIGNGNESPSNPRGMSFDGNGDLYVMCENLYPQTNSYVQRVKNPTSANRTFNKLLDSDQSGSQALDVNINPAFSALVTTDYSAQMIRRYYFDIDAGVLMENARLTKAGGTLNAIVETDYVYFTNDGGYLVRWKPENGETKNVFIGVDGMYAPWGLTIYQSNNLLVCDAAHHKVLQYDLQTMTWKD